MTDLEKFRAEQMLDPEFKAYANEQQPAADLSKALIEARLSMGLSQSELARMAGLTQSHISNIEACEGNPSLKTLIRLANGLNMRLHIEFLPLNPQNKEDI